MRRVISKWEELKGEELKDEYVSCRISRQSLPKVSSAWQDDRHLKPSLFFGYQLEEWKDHRYAMAEPEKTLIDYLYLHHEVKEIEDIEVLRWNSLEINNRISGDRLNSYEAYINSPALSKRLHILKTFLDVAT